ncbi:hypothetical protein D3C81_1467410 [compost metagenome]
MLCDRAQRAGAGGKAQRVAEHGDFLAEAIQHGGHFGHHPTDDRNAVGGRGQFAAEIGNTVADILHHAAHCRSGNAEAVRVGAEFSDAIGHTVTECSDDIAGGIGHALHDATRHWNTAQRVADLAYAVAHATDGFTDVL